MQVSTHTHTPTCKNRATNKVYKPAVPGNEVREGALKNDQRVMWDIKLAKENRILVHLQTYHVLAAESRELKARSKRGRGKDSPPSLCIDYSPSHPQF